jgi:hypothetical protein
MWLLVECFMPRVFVVIGTIFISSLLELKTKQIGNRRPAFQPQSQPCYFFPSKRHLPCAGKNATVVDAMPTTENCVNGVDG